MVIQIKQKEVVLVRHSSIPTFQWDGFQVGQQKRELLISIHDMEEGSWVQIHYRDQTCCGLQLTSGSPHIWQIVAHIGTTRNV